MAIPKSTFVMGALVLGLFGLAVRETAAKKDAGHDRYRDDDDDYGDDEDSAEARVELERLEAQRAQERRDEEAAEQKKLDTLVEASGELYGVEAASLGRALRGVPIEGPKSAMNVLTSERLRAWREATDSEVTFEDVVGDNNVYALSIAPHANGQMERRIELCEKLGRSLRDAWGSGEKDSSGDVTIWLNPMTRQRATFAAGANCELRFERYVFPSEWLNRSKDSLVPISMLGQSATQVAAAVGSAIDADETVNWVRPGVGAGSTQTRLSATAVKGKIVAITASTSANTATSLAVQQQLRQTFGTPKFTDATADVELTYPSRPPIQLQVGENDRLFVFVGKLSVN